MPHKLAVEPDSCFAASRRGFFKGAEMTTVVFSGCPNLHLKAAGAVGRNAFNTTGVMKRRFGIKQVL
jgi:hypothetical protein